MRMLVGYGDKGEMNATIITTKEEVDHQCWYPKRNKVINEYKNIKDNYSWDDEFELESDHAKSTNPPKIYDLRTPQKKSRKTDMYSSDTSDMLFDLSKNNKQTQSEKVMDSKPAKPDTSSKMVSLISKNTAVSLVDRILLKNFCCDKHSKTGTVNKAKKLQKKNSVTVVCLQG